MYYVWINYAHDSYNGQNQSNLFRTNIKKFKFGELVMISKKGYVVRAKKEYLGFVIKNGKNLTIYQNLNLSEKLFKKLQKEIQKVELSIDNKENQLTITA